MMERRAPHTPRPPAILMPSNRSELITKLLSDLKPTAFFFDLDGTLIDSEMLWVRAIIGWLADYGAAAGQDDIAALVFGHSWPDIHDALIERFPCLPQRPPARNAIELRAHYDRLAVDPASIVIQSSVQFYKAAAAIAPCAIVSGSPHSDVVAAAALCGISEETAFVLGAEDYACGKPAPDGYLVAAARLGVEPSRCVVLEDSTAGVMAGLAAGMIVIGLDRNAQSRQDYSGCLLTVRDLSELIRR